MKDCGGHFHGKHLKRSLDYVMNPEKTQDGRLVGAINCQVDSAFEQMIFIEGAPFSLVCM